MVRNPKFFTAVINVCIRRIFAWQKRKARALGVSSPHTAAVTALQRFGSKLNLHPHMHAVLPDGVFADTDSGLTFIQLEPPTDEEVESICIDIARRIVKKSNGWNADTDFDDDLISLSAAHDEALRLPFPERPPTEPKRRPRCAFVAGFSLDADTSCAAHDRAALERLLRYGLRPPFAQSRLSVTPSGKVAYKLQRPWYTGQTEIVLDPIAFLKRLTALIPPPRQNQVRFHGLVAPNAKKRAAFVELSGQKPQPEHQARREPSR